MSNINIKIDQNEGQTYTDGSLADSDSILQPVRLNHLIVPLTLESLELCSNERRHSRQLRSNQSDETANSSGNLKTLDDNFKKTKKSIQSELIDDLRPDPMLKNGSNLPENYLDQIEVLNNKQLVEIDPYIRLNDEVSIYNLQMNN